MPTDRIHRAVSEDGTPIVGRVEGDGPPVVFVHGAAADGDSEWGELVPGVRDRFTCYLPSLRGRGQSGSHPDVSREARVRDVVAFADSIGEPVGLVGVSTGGMLALGAAARTAGVAALVALEPEVKEVQAADARAREEEIIAHAERAIVEGRPAEGLVPFFAWIANEHELAVLSGDEDAVEEFAAYLPTDVAELREGLAPDGWSPTDPSVLRQVRVPTLLLHGSRTALAWFSEGVRFAAEHIPDATVRALPGLGHLGHLVHPDRVADEITSFLAEALQPA
jgi:pimeloyl-ACP methyl ester carboxylesterase